jgi:eukaryotic-like serine/threonine-protein kinase
MATLKERVQWLFRMSLLMFILASVSFLSALTAMRFAIQGREVTMPDVVGKKAVEASQILQGRGVGLRVEDHIYSPLPVDSVVRQSPPGGMRVKIGQYAHVVLSLGPQKAVIPRLEERSLRAARIELLRSGMQVGEISSLYLPGWEEDTVLQQDPTPGNTDATSAQVDLLVALGARPPAYVMPELIGLSLAEAEAKLLPAKLKVAKITFAPAPGALHGIVVGQTPGHGARVEAGGEIEIQVAE